MTPLSFITPTFVEKLLKAWRDDNFSAESLDKLEALLDAPLSLDEKRLQLRQRLYKLLTQDLSDDFLKKVQNTPEEGKLALQWLFQEKNLAQQKSALLYCRYLSMKTYQVQELANAISVSPRTLRRYLVSGFEILSIQLKEELNKTRNAKQRASIREHFPPMQADQVIGIKPLLAELSTWLESQNVAQAISIEGIGGIGKTLLARQLLQQAYRDSQYDHYAWVSARQKEINLSGEITEVANPASTLDDIISRLTQQLGQDCFAGLSTQDKITRLRKLAAQQKMLIFIDNLETSSDVNEVVPNLLKLNGNSRIIFTSRKSLGGYPGVRTLPVPELSFANSKKLVKAEMKRLGLNLSLSDESMQAVYETTGGIPLVLKLATAQFGQVEVKDIIHQLRLGKKRAQNIYTYIYRQAWRLLTNTGKKLLLSMLLVSPDGEDQKWICQMGALTNEEFNQGVGELKELSLVEFAGSIETPKYRIHRLTTTFLQTDVLQGWDHKRT